MKILFLILTLTVAGIFLGACQTAEKPNAIANSQSVRETSPTANTRTSETFNSDANLNRMQNGGAMRDDRANSSGGDETGERKNRGESKGYDERNRTEGDDRNNRSEGDDRRNRNDNRSINSNSRRRGDEGERRDRRNDDRRDNENESDGDGE